MKIATENLWQDYGVPDSLLPQTGAFLPTQHEATLRGVLGDA